MNPRQERGLVIAATKHVERDGNRYLVPSQSGTNKYTVYPHAETPKCTCPDHMETGFKCKHIFAVEYVIQRELFPDGTELTKQIITVKETVKRKTYRQDWPAYNAAQTSEKDKFLSLLHDLCRGIQEPEQVKGRKRIPLADMIFSACYKTYSTFSGRRFMSDLRAASDMGYVGRMPSYNSLFRYLEDPKLFPILRDLIMESSLPLKTVEQDFAVDSSGFSVSRFVRWFSEKYGKEHSGRDWVKVHLCCGVKTNVVTAVEIEERRTNDSTQFFPLVEATAQNFTIREMSGDKAYLSQANLETVASHGGTAYIPFKSNSTGAVGGLFRKMFHYFTFRQEEFAAHYHKRSNVESTFSMIKAKFRDNVRSKTDVAMKNEVLCKILCHNICVLIQEMYELGIEPEFWGKTPIASNQTNLPQIYRGA